MSPVLPWEIDAAILEWIYRFSQSHVVDYRTLASCALVCKSWTLIAQRLLYRRIPLVPTALRREQFTKSIEALPHLGTYVRALFTSSFTNTELLAILPYFPHIRKLTFGPTQMFSATEAAQLRALGLSPTALHCSGGHIPVYQLLDIWPSTKFLSLDYIQCDAPSDIPAPPHLEGISMMQLLPDQLANWLVDASVFGRSPDGRGLRQYETRVTRTPFNPGPMEEAVKRLGALSITSYTGPIPHGGLETIFTGLQECILIRLPTVPFRFPSTVCHAGYHWHDFFDTSSISCVHARHWSSCVS
ncbi:hypothetical protein FA95DRAFT_926137 [Auriscalpium vulgare]|uniref:Uncharacterized protein n=1 Tax=Auriscalpium vulgare TaxID=40419 RepID=A0ACB8R7Y1_9AGAM|nr:hypothetical protein FA95DRAFT_926137 [Auriscalpium vulgare]